MLVLQFVYFILFHFLVFNRLQKQVPNHNLVIVSYDVIRNDIDFFRYKLHVHVHVLLHVHVHVLVQQ